MKVLSLFDGMNRWYWSNIRTRRQGLFGEVHTDIPQPADRGILLRDILEADPDEKYYLSEKSVNAIMAHAERAKKAGNGFAKKTAHPDGKMNALKCGGAGNDDIIYADGVCARITGRDPENPTSWKPCADTVQMLEARFYGKTGTLTTVCKDNVIIQRARGYNKGGIHNRKSPAVSSSGYERNNMVVQLNPSKESGGVQPYQQNRVYHTAGKSPALLAGLSCGSNAILNSDSVRIRRLTPTECARLQTIPDWYEWECPATQQYRMLGNGWTVEVIKHILSFLPAEYMPQMN